MEFGEMGAFFGHPFRRIGSALSHKTSAALPTAVQKEWAEASEQNKLSL